LKEGGFGPPLIKVFLMKVKVYNIKTKEWALVEGVDAKEYVKSGGWSMEKPEPEVKPAKNTRKKKA
jgi:hypothetical protein